MSIRIHELAKKIGMDNKELLALLKERKYDVKSVSSTIDNISAEALEEEFASKRAAAEAAPQAPAAAASAPAAPEAPAPAPAAPVHTGPAGAPPPVATPTTPAAAAPAPPAPERPAAPPQVKLPPGVFVKSREDVQRQREEQARATQVARPAPAVVMPPPPRPTAPGIRPPASASPAPAPSRPPFVSQPGRPPAASPAPASVPPAAAAAPRPAPAPAAPPPPPVSKGSPTVPPTPVAPVAAPVPMGEVRTIQIKPPIIVRDFALLLGLKPFKLISELMELGIFASMNQTIEEAVAVKLAEKHNVMLEVKHRGEQQAPVAPTEKDLKKVEEAAAEEEKRNLQSRPPVVCILGHVDHGKTSLLDAIRKSKVAAGEAGGITQHIGAYQIEYNSRKITFLDTPGHAAFNKMRARGASVTDIAVLVVAADDGFMPQTDEALKYIKEAGVALIVAVNKMDVKGANIDQVKSHMQQRNIAPEDWGGETITVPVSAVKGTGINDLLEMILLQADVLELKANPKADASGVIVESQLDVGRGPLATVIVQRGTLRVGDAIVSGAQWARVRAMFDDQGKNLKEAPPATPVRVIGWSGAPDSGATFTAVKNAREAERIAEEEQDRLRKQTSAAAATPKEVSVESLFANIAATQQKVLKVIVKSDVYGSAEAVRGILESIKSSKVSLEIVASEVGLVTKNDVQMASAAGSVIIAFNTRLENGVLPLAKHHGVRIETFEIIYELSDKVREMMADLLEPELKEAKLGAAEVRATFPLAKGFVAGCLVTEGKVTRNASARLRRKRDIIHEGKVQTLKRFKDDANEVRAGLECGIKLDDFNGYEVGDVIECFEVQKVRAAL
jgi:translation initiation factor IF-2